MTGVTTHAIRIWERRYNALSPGRTAGGARLYTDADVQRLRQIKRLLTQGYTISAIAKLDMPELSRLSASDPSTPSAGSSSVVAERARSTIDELVAALVELDLDRAGRSLAQATNAFSPHDLVLEVLAPTLERIGSRWEKGELSVASEHAATALLRTHLGSLLAAQTVGPRASVVCATPEGEQHELGALLAAVVIAMQGKRALYLGANLPTRQLVEAVRLSRAEAVALSIVGLSADRAFREIEALCQALPQPVQILVGGRGAGELEALPQRVRVLASLPDLEDWLLAAAL